MEVHILRHTRPDFPPNTCYGQTDYPVAESFVEELAEIQPKLHRDYDRIIASPLLRCQTLAKSLFAEEVQRIETIEDFREYSFGDWDGCSWDDIPRDAFDYWAENPIERAAPNGESVVSFYQRIETALDSVLSDTISQKVLVIAHAGVMRCLWCKAAQMPLSAFLNIEITYGELNGFRFGEQPDQHRVLFKQPSVLSVASARVADPPSQR